jgi:16S rRNA (adenine1518-N6/adenine1519-N6)-dimethyltransferase
MKSVIPKKSLGQNFLNDEKSLRVIVAAAELDEWDNVLEIGPGTGVLTKELVKYAGRVIAIEKDEQLARLIKNFEFRISKFEILSGDILKVNLPELIEKSNFFPYKVVANIPYYITGQIIRLLLETKYRPEKIVLLVQKEVAERICAGVGQLSILAVSVQYYGMPKIVGIVPRESFLPAPEVDSAVIAIDLFKDKERDVEAEKKFFHIVKIGFSNRRKTLCNNLSFGLKKNKQEIEKILERCGIDKNVRAQELSVEQWKRLNNAV